MAIPSVSWLMQLSCQAHPLPNSCNTQTYCARYAIHVSALQMNIVWCSRMTTLSAAKHRFDSWTKPFSRLCLNFEAVLTTAQEVHEERRWESTGRHAKAFLNMVDEEMAFSLAMMTDAGEENLELVRSYTARRCPQQCFLRGRAAWGVDTLRSC